MTNNNGDSIERKLEKLNMTVSDMRSLLWTKERLSIGLSEISKTMCQQLGNNINNIVEDIVAFMKYNIREYYETKVDPGSLVVMLAGFSGLPPSVNAFMAPPSDEDYKKTFPKLEPGDIILFLGLNKETGEAKWLINEVIYEHSLPVGHFKVLAKNIGISIAKHTNK